MSVKAWGGVGGGAKGLSGHDFYFEKQLYTLL